MFGITKSGYRLYRTLAEFAAKRYKPEGKIEITTDCGFTFKGHSFDEILANMKAASNMKHLSLDEYMDAIRDNVAYFMDIEIDYKNYEEFLTELRDLDIIREIKKGRLTV